jgi:hypothetical protein
MPWLVKKAHFVIKYAMPFSVGSHGKVSLKGEQENDMNHFLLFPSEE